MRTQKQLQTGSGVVQSFPSLKRTVRSRTRLQVSAESRTVSVTFRIHRPVKYGLMVTITGGSPALSSWGAGIPMNWSEGHNWIATVDLPVGWVTFAAVCVVTLRSYKRHHSSLEYLFSMLISCSGLSVNWKPDYVQVDSSLSSF